MAERANSPVVRWGEELRQARRARRRAGHRLLATAAASALVTALCATLVARPRPLLLWNASASSPKGLYRISSAQNAQPGDWVVAWAPPTARALAAERRYLPSNVPLVKRVAAQAGDRVCAIADMIFIDGQLTAFREASDPAGRPLPWWIGCERLRQGELFLLAANQDYAFDGRYFGVTRPDQLIGRARLLWLR